LHSEADFHFTLRKKAKSGKKNDQEILYIREKKENLAPILNMI